MNIKINITLCLLLFVISVQAQPGSQNPVQDHRQIQLPYNRLLQPAGTQIFFGDPSLENHALDAALSPDGKWLAVLERYSIVFISTDENKIKFTLSNSAIPDLKGGMNTYSGILWNKESDVYKVYWSGAGNRKRSFVASAVWNGVSAEFSRVYEYSATSGSDMALPNGILIANEGSREYLYVTLNGNNTLVKQDLDSGDTIWVAKPGVAPYGIVKASGKLYVTNWAGRYPDPGDKEVAGVPWGRARVNNSAGGSTREGSVTVIDPENGRILKNIIVGLHPNAITANKNGKFVYVTNSNSDNISVISTSADTVSEVISVRLQPFINPFFGDSPEGLCLSKDERTLYVANGMDNALAIIRLGRQASDSGNGQISNIKGFLPTGAYPSSVTVLENGPIYVCNLEAAGASLAQQYSKSATMAYNSHHMLASVSVIPVPGEKEIKAYTDTVIALNDLARATLSREKPRDNISPKPVPDRIGEPSVFRHVIYIIKENRTYDQILGDLKQGNGDPSLCIFGADVTPNTHKLSEDYILFDNFMVSGKCSAEGHQWTDASIVTDYIEKNMRAWFRSYPHVQDDALVYAPTGFLWDNCLRHGKSIRIYGEASFPVLDKTLSWTDIYNKYKNGEKIDFHDSTVVEPVRDILCQTYPSFGNHEFTDSMRADAFIRELHDFEALPGDSLPELMIMALPNDHTNGMRPGYPTPRAMVADNDLSLGRIVEAVSKSRFWKNTVIFVVEDDSQSGWDHVSAYRTVSLVISPYSKLSSCDHTYYTQPSMVRTIEQILGLPPMNIQDAIANVMTDCFGDQPDLTPYRYLSSKVRMDEMNPQLVSLNGKALQFAKKSMLPEFDGIDTGDDDLLNRIIWFSEKGSLSYPSKYAGESKEKRDPD
ncbi:MAG: bifunctional YncE family protein/alkaline phosphatase family protein [Bacteroidales bacterium]|jgi:YVTN family beta-propeller protein